jgi:hypothetical protein
MSYSILVQFDREASDDEQVVEHKPEYVGLTLREAFHRQFHTELQEAFDKSKGALAWLFKIVEVKGANKRIDAALEQKVTPMNQKVAALERIKWARDYCAEHGEYPPGLFGKDQQFDDWAADVAERALKES